MDPIFVVLVGCGYVIALFLGFFLSKRFLRDKPKLRGVLAWGAILATSFVFVVFWNEKTIKIPFAGIYMLSFGVILGGRDWASSKKKKPTEHDS